MPGVTTAYQTGVHGSRPAANAGCILYSCTTHGLVYRSDGSSWTTWLTLSAGSVSGTPALTFGTSASGGAASTFVATDATLPIFDATSPSTQAFGDAAAVGAAAFAARRDHKHAMMATPAGTILGSSYSTNASVTTTSTTLVDMDATRIAVTFTAPASGNVLVTITCRCTPDLGGGTGGAVGDQLFFGVRESSSIIAGPSGMIRMVVTGATIADLRWITYQVPLLGISAGSHTYKGAFCVTNGTRQVGFVSETAAEPATMLVTALA